MKKNVYISLEKVCTWFLKTPSKLFLVSTCLMCLFCLRSHKNVEKNQVSRSLESIEHLWKHPMLSTGHNWILVSINQQYWHVRNNSRERIDNIINCWYFNKNRSHFLYHVFNQNPRLKSYLTFNFHNVNHFLSIKNYNLTLSDWFQYWSNFKILEIILNCPKHLLLLFISFYS
jgi:hypothetical protein